MTEKENAEAKDKAKTSKSRRSAKSTTTAQTAKTASTRKSAAKTPSRRKTSASTAKTADADGRPKTPKTAKTPKTRTRAKRSRPKTEGEASPETQGNLTFEATAQAPLPTVGDQSTVPPEAKASVQEDPGTSALAEWAALGPEQKHRRTSGRSRSRPQEKAGPSASKPRASDAEAALLDVPAWPELSDEPGAAPPPVQQAPAEDEALDAMDRAEEAAQDVEEAPTVTPSGSEQGPEDSAAATEDPTQKSSRRRRRRRRGRNRSKDKEGQEEGTVSDATAAPHTKAGRQSERAAPAAPAAAGKPRQNADAARPEKRAAGTRDRKPAAELWEEDLGLQEEEPEATPPPDEKNSRLMLINVAEGEECRIAILHQKRLEELFIERASAESHVGNIYKGRVTNVEPSIQAAFVDFGLPKNGFLHISDLQPQYFPGGMKTVEEVGRKTPRRDRPPIQKCLRRGQEIIVQIIKEGIGTKGPTLTTYISIPGRYLVMMPGMNRLGVSRRIEDEEARRKMRKVLDELNLPKEMGFILRTAGLDRAKRELQQDLLYLQRLWKVVARRIKNERAPCELYRESDLVIRTIRDVFSPDFSKIIVDDAQTADKVRDFLAIAMPRSSAPVELYTKHRPLFHEYKLEQEIERINSRYVPLPSGGSLVIESTEALVAIDVNSGKYREHDDAEETAYRINIEAAEEIARQLRLRDLGGLILCDLIDMRLDKHRRGVERALRDALKKHKERAKCLRMSQFGIIEMTRQRMRPSIKRSIYQDCPHCRGTGLVKNSESMTLDIMRLLRLATHHEQVDSVEVRVSPNVAFQLQNRKRAAIHKMEEETGRHVIVRTDENLGPDQYAFECLDKRGTAIRMDDLPDTSRSLPELRSKRRSGGSEIRNGDNGRETLADVFD